MPTYSPKASEITRAWHVIDADGLVLGRMCTEAARVLRGKHKPIFAPHIDTGDHVVVINASKVVLTKDKLPTRVCTATAATRVVEDRVVRRSCSAASRRRHPSQHRRHAAEGPSRPPDDQEAQGLRRARAPARRPAPVARSHCRQGPSEREGTRSWQPSRSPRPPVAARSRRSVSLRPGTARITINGKRVRHVLPDGDRSA
jgi:ribosomal protein L13